MINGAYPRNAPRAKHCPKPSPDTILHSGSIQRAGLISVFDYPPGRVLLDGCDGKEAYDDRVSHNISSRSSSSASSDLFFPYPCILSWYPCSRRWQRFLLPLRCPIVASSLPSHNLVPLRNPVEATLRRVVIHHLLIRFLQLGGTPVG